MVVNARHRNSRRPDFAHGSAKTVILDGGGSCGYDSAYCAGLKEFYRVAEREHENTNERGKKKKQKQQKQRTTNTRPFATTGAPTTHEPPAEEVHSVAPLIGSDAYVCPALPSVQKATPPASVGLEKGSCPSHAAQKVCGSAGVAYAKVRLQSELMRAPLRPRVGDPNPGMGGGAKGEATRRVLDAKSYAEEERNWEIQVKNKPKKKTKKTRFHAPCPLRRRRSTSGTGRGR